MIGTSRFEYGLIRTSIFVIRATTPLCILYCLSRPFTLTSSAFHPLELWPLGESVFYLLVYLPLKERSQRKAEHPPLLAPDERKALFAECIRNIPDPKEYLSRWFMDAPLSEIKRDNVKQFFSWAFLNSAVRRSAHETELEAYTQQLELAIGREIPQGLGNSSCLRLTIDEVSMRHRPLLWYLIVFGADQLTHLWFLWHGFSYYRTSFSSFLTTIPFRPLTVTARHRSPVKTLPYWLRTHRSKTKLPIVFLHGIGIGLMTYVPFLSELNQSTSGSNDDIGIVAIEILPISFRITRPVLQRYEMCRQIKIILQRHGYDRFVLVTHSYGSVIATHLLRDPDISGKIASMVLVDPVSILLHLPDVAYNFTYRKPVEANEWQLWYFASMDMGVAHTLGRGFFWADNVLWKEDLRGRKCTVFLGGRDLIVGTANVWKYLVEGHLSHQADVETTGRTEHEISRASDVWEDEHGLKVFWSEELDHAQIFDSIPRRHLLVREVLDRAGVQEELS